MFKTVLNKNAGEKMKVPANLLKHLLASKPFYQQGKFFMILKQFLQNQMKLNQIRRIKRKKDRSYTVKFHKHIQTSFTLAVHF